MPLPSTSSTIDTFGGEKQNYLADAVDPDTDVNASAWNQVISDLAQISRNIDLGEVWFDGYSASASITPSYHQALWGNSVSVRPTITYSLDGYSQSVYLVTLPATVTDPLGTSHSVNLAGSFATNYYKTSANAAEGVFIVTAKKITSNTFKVYVRGDDGASVGTGYTFQVRYR